MILPKISKKPHEIENILGRRGCVPGASPLDPSLKAANFFHNPNPLPPNRLSLTSSPLLLQEYPRHPPSKNGVLSWE